MKPFRPVLLSAAGLTSLWLWHLQTRLDEREGQLSAQITKAEQALAEAEKVSSRPGKKDGAAIANDASFPEAVPLKAAEFMELAGEITRLETSIQAGGDRELMRVKITEVFTRLAVTPAEELKAILDQLPGVKLSADGRDQITSAIMSLLAKSDPPAAAAYALENHPKAGTLETAIRSWAKLDPVAAAKWLDDAEAGGRLPPHVTAEQLRLILLPRQIAADPGGAAVSQIARLQAANLGDFFAETARLLTSPEQRRSFLEKLTAVPGLSSEAVGQYLSQVSRETSVEAATDLLQRVGPSLSAGQFDKVATATATARIDAGTPAQADWLLKNLRGPDREPAISQLMEAWTKADFNAAGTWLRNQAPSADHDAAIAAFAPMVADKEPPSAVDWALTIADPARKASVLGNIYRDWNSRAPDQAAAYFQEKGLLTAFGFLAVPRREARSSEGR